MDLFGVAVFPEEELETVFGNLERVEQCPDHIAEAVGGKVDLRVEAVGYLVGLSQVTGIVRERVVAAVADVSRVLGQFLELIRITAIESPCR